MHSGGDQTQYLIGPRSTSLAPSSLIRRAVVSADKRFAIGFGGSRVVRIDLTRGFSPAESAFAVLLDGVISPDAWIRRSAIPDGIPNIVPIRPRPQIIESTKVEPSHVNVSDAVAGRFRKRGSTTNLTGKPTRMSF